ncbi:hypothetical protein ACHHYP_05871 [Achlya hypogyna]|uniref:Uncharacterized protein n=1 Tax=Achlya hypogyna TaxID=1202772 RepID=A0A1V9YW74_ACHHY|nr:hypothetical protein ACHHYP_05871 [Achlya hypogyna]
MGAELQASHEQAWEDCLAAIKVALGPIARRDDVALLFLKRWKRQAKSEASPDSLVTPVADMGVGRLVHFDWKIGVRVGAPAKLPSIMVTLKWTIKRSSGDEQTHVHEVLVADFHALRATVQQAAQAMDSN